MTHIVIKVPVIESERGWGSKIDDHMVCISEDEAKVFIKDFNSINNESSVPDWYMYAENSLLPITITDEEYNKLVKEKRIWFKNLK